jgi:transcriptional regulator of acetoin/glycerol metabolism
VRELEMALAAALAVDPSCVKRAHLPAIGGAASAVVDRSEDIERKRELEALLALHKGNVSHVAKAMGKARSLVQKWLARYGIDAERYRG